MGECHCSGFIHWFQTACFKYLFRVVNFGKDWKYWSIVVDFCATNLPIIMGFFIIEVLKLDRKLAL